MTHRLSLAAAICASALVAGVGCTVARDQQTMGSYVDDAVLTTRVKAKFADNPTVSALSIKVETFEGVVMLSGVAKTDDEKAAAEQLASTVFGVKSVRNGIMVRS